MARLLSLPLVDFPQHQNPVSFCFCLLFTKQAFLQVLANSQAAKMFSFSSFSTRSEGGRKIAKL